MLCELVEQLVQKSLAVMMSPSSLTTNCMTSQLLKSKCSDSMVNNNDCSRRQSSVSISSIKSGHFSALPSNPSVSMGDTSEIATNPRGNYFELI